MSLLAKHPKALQFLFNEEVYRIAGGDMSRVSAEAVLEEEPGVKTASFEYLGGNNRFFLLLVNEPNHPFLAPDQLETLTKILQAKGLQLDDVAVVNLAHYPQSNFNQLYSFFSFNKLCLFGIAPQAIALPSMASNEPLSHQNAKVLATFTIAEMQQTQHKKVAFWNVMKSF